MNRVDNLHINNMQTKYKYENIITEDEYTQLFGLIRNSIKFSDNGDVKSVDKDNIYSIVHSVINYLSAGTFGNNNIEIIDDLIGNESHKLGNVLFTSNNEIKQYSSIDQVKLHKDLSSHLQQESNQLINKVKENITDSSNVDVINDSALNSLVSFGILAIIMSYVSKNIQNTQKGFLIKQNLINTLTDQLADIGSLFSTLMSIINSNKLDVKTISSQNNNQPIIIILMRLFGGDNSVVGASDILSNIDQQAQTTITNFLNKNNINFAQNNSMIYVMQEINSVINNCNANLGLFSTGSNSESISLFSLDNNFAQNLDTQLNNITAYCTDLRNINFQIPLSTGNDFKAFLYAALVDGGDKNLQDLINFQSPNLWYYILDSFGKQMNINGKNYQTSDVINSLKSGDTFFIDAVNDMINKNPNLSINTYLKNFSTIYKDGALKLPTYDIDDLAESIAFYCCKSNDVRSPVTDAFNALNIASIDPKLWDEIVSGNSNAVSDLKKFLVKNIYLVDTNQTKIIDEVSNSKNTLSGLNQKYNAYIDSVTQSLNMVQGVYNNFIQFTSITYR
jgi:hypothetical protein